MRRSAFLPTLALLAAAFGCGSAPDATPGAAASVGAELSPTAAARYEDVLTYWVDAPQDAWLNAVDHVVSQFYQVCGDTFCEGDYSDLTSLELTCSVSPVRGNVHACTWTLAGSAAIIQASSGWIALSKPTYACKFAPTGTIAQLRDFFAAAGSLQAPLPGLSQSLYDVLGDCFQHPIGTSPLPAAGSGPYVDPIDGTGADQGKWIDMLAALQGSFPSLCEPGGLCAADRPWLQPLTFRCSMNVKSSALDKCLWTFGEGGATVTPSTGTIHTTQSTRYCMVPVSGTADALSGALTAAGTSDALHRPLPGSGVTLASVLSTCLR